MREHVKAAIRRGFRSGLQWLKPVAICVLAWVLFIELKFISRDMGAAGSMIIAAVMFFLAMPISIIGRLDLLYLNFPRLSSSASVLIAFAYVVVNFLLWNIIRSLVRDRRERKETSTVSAESPEEVVKPKQGIARAEKSASEKSRTAKHEARKSERNQDASPSGSEAKNEESRPKSPQDPTTNGWKLH